MDLGKKMKILWKNAKNTAKTAPRGAVFAQFDEKGLAEFAPGGANGIQSFLSCGFAVGQKYFSRNGLPSYRVRTGALRCAVEASSTAPHPRPRSSLPKTNPPICFGEERQRRERAFPLAGEANDTELAATWRTRARNAAQAPPCRKTSFSTDTAKTAPRGAVFAMLGARRTDARPGAAASLRVSQWQNCMHQIYFLK